MAKRVMIAAVGSGCGKTTVTCGILACLKRKNLKVAACKCGPDYIDPMFHSRVLSIPSGNLDGFFLEEDGLQEVAERYARGKDILVLEGVMGYYDGIGMTGRASSYLVARATGTPVVLIIDCKGMSSSVEAVLQGFLGYKDQNMIYGVIFNRLSEALYAPLKERVEALGITCVGYIPPLPGELLFESRHLGLVTAGEIADFELKVEKLADIMEHTLSLDALLGIATQQCMKANHPCAEGMHGMEKELRVAVARDEAFCFLYEDNLRLLEQRGCEIIYFSPLRDQALPPDCQGLLLSGGYPELYAKELSENTAMLASVRQAIEDGICCMAECGGYLYLHRELEGSDGISYSMAGVIDAGAYREKQLKHFGYVYTRLSEDGLLGKAGDCYRAHEFHYMQSDRDGTALLAEKAAGGDGWRTAYMTDTLYAGFPHFFLAGNPGIADNFIGKMRRKQSLTLEKIKERVPKLPSEDVYRQSKEKWDAIAKPLQGLGKLEELVSRIAAIQDTPDISIKKRAVIAMCADNGIVEEGVTQTDSSVTAVVAENMAKGISSVCKMGQVAGVSVIPVDIGMLGEVAHENMLQKKVANGTNNFALHPAMSEGQMEKAIVTGMEVVRDCKEKGYQILAAGEMGIGNTTTSTAVICALLGLNPDEVTGRGAGLSDEGLQKKRKVIREAIRRYDLKAHEPYRILQCVGGLDLAGLAGVFLGGAYYRIPVVIDGIITAAAALLAFSMHRECAAYMLPSHCSKEPAMQMVLERLGLEPVIYADMALGEGTGAVMLFPMLDMALSVYAQNVTFDDIHIEAYKPF